MRQRRGCQRASRVVMQTKSARQQRHAQLNDVIWRAIKRAQIPIAKEPERLSRTDGKRPDRATLIPWSQGKPLAWDVTVLYTFAESHLKDTAVLAGAAVNHAATFRNTKYMSMTTTHTFVPIAIETSGTWNNNAIEIVQEIGKRINHQ